MRGCVADVVTGAAWKLLAVARGIERPSVDAFSKDEVGMKAEESVLEDAPVAATAARMKLAVTAALMVGGERRETNRRADITAPMLQILRSVRHWLFYA